MRLLSLHLRNIKSHRDTELHFSPGINVLSGPNGIGKSTVFEAIGYALFGVDARSFVGNAERFVSLGAKRGEVAVTFTSDGEETFRVSRTVGGQPRWLLAREVAGAFEVEEHKDAEETEGRLRELLGLDNGRPLSEQFELVIGPFQNEFLGPFVIRQATRRRDKFDEILGIDAWRRTFNETKVLASAIKAKMEALESAVGPLADQVAALPEKREAQASAIQERQITEARLREHVQQFKALEGRLANLDRCEQAVKDLQIAIDGLGVRIDNGREKIAGQKVLIAEAERARTIVAETSTGKEAFERAEQHLTGLRRQLTLQRKLEQEVADLNTRVRTLAERRAAEKQAVERINVELAAEESALAEKRKALAADASLRKLAARLPEIRRSVKAQQERIGRIEGVRVGLEEGQEKLSGGLCSFFQEPCLNIAERPPGDVFSAKLAELSVERERRQDDLVRLEGEEAEAAGARERLQALEVQREGLDELAARLAARREANEHRAAGVARLEKEQESAQRLLDERQAALGVYGTLQADIDVAEAEQERHQEARDLHVANQEQAAKLEDRRAELKKFEHLLTQLQDELAAREAALHEARKAYDPEEHQELRRQKDVLGREAGALEQKIEGIKAEVERLAGEIGKLVAIETELTAKQAQIRVLGRKEELVRFLRNRVFRSVSSFLSEKFREEIGQRADRIYRTIAEADEELRWAEDYRIVLRDMAGGEIRERSDDQLSGGQTMSAVVALRLALLQTLGARVAFFDEPTSNLDAVRRENLAHAFRAIDVGKEEVTEHWYDQLFLISHDVAFAEVTDQTIVLG